MLLRCIKSQNKEKGVIQITKEMNSEDRIPFDRSSNKRHFNSNFDAALSTRNGVVNAILLVVVSRNGSNGAIITKN